MGKPTLVSRLTLTPYLTSPHLTLPMRRAALQAFRSARRLKHLRGHRILTTSPSLSSSSSPSTSSYNHAVGSHRAASTRRVLHSSMHVRNFSVAALAAAVASGAWYY